MTKSEETIIALMQNDIKSILSKMERMEQIIADYPVTKSTVQSHAKILWLIGGTVITGIAGAIMSLVFIAQ